MNNSITNHKPAKVRSIIVAPTMIFLILVAVILAGWWTLHRQEIEDIKQDTAITAEQAALRVEAFFSTRIAMMLHFRRMFADDNVGSELAFTENALNIHKHFPGIQSINWIDTEGVIRWVVPETGNAKVKGINLRKRRKTAHILEAAERTGKPQMTDTIDLVQGGKGFAVNFSVKRSGRLLGTLGIVFNISALVDQSLLQSLAGNYSFKITEKGVELYSHGSTSLDHVYSASHKFSVLDREWNLTLFPTLTRNETETSDFGWAIIALALLLSALLSWVLFLFLSRQDALKTSEERQRSLFDNAYDSIFITDLKTKKFIDVNDNACNRLGYSRQELLSMSYRDFSDESIDVGAIIKELYETGSVKCESIHLHKDGTRIPVEISSQIIELRGAKVHQSFVRDITERKKAEERISKAFYDNPIMQSITRLDDGVIIDINRAWLDTLGFKREEVIGRTAADVDVSVDFTPDVRFKLINQIRSEDGYVSVEAMLRCKDGEIRLFNSNAELVELDGKEHLLLASIDITARKQAEQAQKESEERFRHFTESASDRYWETDHEHRLVQIADIEESDFVVQPSGARHWEVQGASTDDDWRQLKLDMDEHRPFKEYPMLFSSDDREFHRLISGVPYFDEDGNFKGYRGTSRDVTETVKRQDQLRQAQKMEAVGQLSSGIAHDFNNLLMAALGNVEFLEEKVAEPGLAEHVAIAKRAILRGADLTKHLLAFSRKQSLKPERIDVGVLINSLSVMFKRTLPANIKIEWNIATHLCPVMIDQSQLENALLNLVLNSRDAMLAGGVLTIGCENTNISKVQQISNPEIKAGDYVTVSVEDTGMGIKKSHLDNIMVPFFTTKGLGGGSGLGLSMVYGFVLQSGGFVDIQSEPGSGAKVILYLPRNLGEGDVSAAVFEEKEDIPLGKGETVLIIEDEPDVRETTILQLENLNYQVIDGGDGKSVLDTCNEDNCIFDANIDLVLSDVVLPNETSGPELVEIVQKCYPAAKALLMTGYAETDVIQTTDGKLKFPIIGKPFTKSKLANKIFGLLNGASA